METAVLEARSSPLEPEVLARPRYAGRQQRLAGAALTAIAALFALGHAGHLADAPDSVDTANFVLGVRRFNVREHQPHPPGYPVYIALGRLARAFVDPTEDEGARSDSAREARALSALGVLVGALAVFPIATFFRTLDRPLATPVLSVVSAGLVLACPLYWFSSVRPLSDVVGLAAAMLVQSLLVLAIARAWPVNTIAALRLEQPRRAPALIVVAACLTGVAAGVRSQTIWQTVPLLFLALGLITRAGLGSAGLWLGSLVAVLTGVLVWLVPLASDGLGNYLQFLREQAAGDVTGAQMLALEPSAQAFVQAAYDTLILPWGSPGLGAAVIALAVLGFVRLWRTGGRRLAVLGVCTVPYGVVHLLFQDTAFVRYALPLVPATVWLAANGLTWLSGRAAAAVAVALALGSLSLSASTVERHTGSGTPAMRALNDTREFAAALRGEPRVIAMHHGIWRALRGEHLPFPMLDATPRYEWLEVARHWLEGEQTTVWFLASPRRTDLSFVDPASRRLVRSYSWTFDRRPYLGAARPGGVDWYEITPPGWFVTRGWSLTPEMAGVSAFDSQYAKPASLRAYIRRRDSPALILLGGRVPASPAGRQTRAHVSLDGRPLGTFDVATGTPFIRFVPIEPWRLRGTGRYAELTIHAAPDHDAAALLPLSLQQFDVQSPDGLLLGFGEGWHDAEYEWKRGEMWRWSGRRAALHVRSFGRSVALRLRGDLPGRAYSRGLVVNVQVGSHELARFRIMQEFDVEIPLSSQMLEQAQGLVWLEADRTYVPAAVEGTGDTRELALRVVDVQVRAAGVPAARGWSTSRESHRLWETPRVGR